MRKIISMVLVFTLLCGIFAGCGSKKKGNSGDGETLRVGIPQNSNIADFDDNAFTKYIEENLGINLEFEFFSSSASEALQQISLSVSSGEELPDVFWGFQGMDIYTLYEYGQDGFFIDLTDLIEKNAPYYNEQFKKLTEEEQNEITRRGTDPSSGGFYGMPLLTTTLIDNLQSIMFINQTWLDKLGLKAPTNVDELYNVLKAFATKDPNGNGVPDELAILGKTSGATDLCCYIINAYVYYDSLHNFNVTDGKVWTPFTTDEYRKALVFMNKLCAEGLLPDLNFTISSVSEFIPLITPATGTALTGIFCGHPSSYTDPTSNLLEEYTALMPLADATGKGGYNVVRPNDLIFCSYITKDCKNPELAMKFLDFFYKDETVTRGRHGEKDVDWEVSSGKDIYGNDVTTKVLNGEAFFSGNQTWGRNGNSILTPDNYNVVEEAADAWNTMVNKLLKGTFSSMTNYPVPAETATGLVYTQEEQEVRTEYSTLLNDFILAQRNLFITGGKDPSNDADWNQYLKDLEDFELSKLVSITQAAYDRVNK